MTNKNFEFEEIRGSKNEPSFSEEGMSNVEVLLDIPVTVSVELGRSRMKINELLKLNTGSIVELDKIVGEPLDIYVNGKLIAQGEAVISNEKLGIRLTQVINNKKVNEIFKSKSTAA